MKATLTLIVLAIFPISSHGETLTAICGNFNGVSYEKSANGKVIQNPDKLLGGDVTIIWSGGPTVTVSTVDLRGRPVTWDGNIINHRSDPKAKFLTFVISGPWRTDMYTIDLRENTLLLSSHYPHSPFDYDALDKNATVNTSAAYIGTCKVGF